MRHKSDPNAPPTTTTYAFRRARIKAVWGRLTPDERMAYRDEIGDGEDVSLELVNEIEGVADGRKPNKRDRVQISKTPQHPR